jgi:hypothetical protein
LAASHGEDGIKEASAKLSLIDRRLVAVIVIDLPQLVASTTVIVE